jgi:hypothetical protein
MIRRNVKLISSIGLAIVLFASTFIGAVNVNAKVANAETQDDIVQKAQQYVDEALNEKTFYKYNWAYEEIGKIDDTTLKNNLLAKLSTIANDVWTDDVKKFNKMLDNLVATNGSGKVYDDMNGSVDSSSMGDMDKGYLLGELTSWGKKLVYTSDYSDAVNKVVYIWNCIKQDMPEQSITAAVKDAQTAVNKVKNGYSKQYLKDQIDAATKQVDFNVIEIN